MNPSTSQHITCSRRFENHDQVLRRRIVQLKISYQFSPMGMVTLTCELDCCHCGVGKLQGISKIF